MKKMPLKYRRYTQEAPGFVQAVAGAKLGASPIVYCRLESFKDDPWLLYSCLWYALSEGVTVTFPAPRTK